MAELESGPEWVAGRDAKDWQLEAREKLCAADESALVQEMRSVGYDIDSVWDWVNCRRPVFGDVIWLGQSLEIEIHNCLSGSFILESEPRVCDAIVILDTSLPQPIFVSKFSRKSLVLQFDDITESVSRKISPTTEPIKREIEFVVTSEKLMVCCRAGQSRSASAAFAIAFEKLGEDAASELLNPREHSPNFRIIQIAAGLIERPGLLNTCEEWGCNSGDIRLTDYYTEQDIDSAIEAGALHIGFCSTRPDAEAEDSEKTAKFICSELEKSGLKYEWDGGAQSRIQVKLNWQFRNFTEPKFE